MSLSESQLRQVITAVQTQIHQPNPIVLPDLGEVSDGDLINLICKSAISVEITSLHASLALKALTAVFRHCGGPSSPVITLNVWSECWDIYLLRASSVPKVIGKDFLHQLIQILLHLHHDDSSRLLVRLFRPLIHQPHAALQVRASLQAVALYMHEGNASSTSQLLELYYTYKIAREKEKENEPWSNDSSFYKGNLAFFINDLLKWRNEPELIPYCYLAINELADLVSQHDFPYILLLLRSNHGRLAGLHLSITSTSMKKPVNPAILSILKETLPLLFTETSPGPRNESLALITKLLLRIRTVLHHLNTSSELDETQNEQIALHEQFIKHIMHVVSSHFHPESPYHQTIMALKCFEILVNSRLDHSLNLALPKTASPSTWPHFVPLLNPSLLALLANAMMNPYLDVRATSAFIMNTWVTSQDLLFGAIPRRFVNYLLAAEIKAQSSGRADQANGVGRMYAICFRLASITSPPTEIVPLPSPALEFCWWQCRYSTIKRLLTFLEHAIDAFQTDNVYKVMPMHGHIICLRYCLELPTLYKDIGKRQVEIPKWERLQHRIIQALKLVWECTKPVLLDEGSKGSFPEEPEPEVDEDSNTESMSAMGLSWRALKEASLLMKLLFDRNTDAIPDAIPDASMFRGLAEADAKELMLLALDQLTVLRHTGAFSAVSQAFAAGCTLPIPGLLATLYEKTLTAVCNLSPYIVRRSAGIPSLMTGILMADAKSPAPLDENNPLYIQQALKDLIQIAQSPLPSDHSEASTSENIVYKSVSLPQIHALNCLTEMLNSAILYNGSSGRRPCRSDESNRILHSSVTSPEILNLAGFCLRSSAWPVRNCGLMLFKALMERIVGLEEKNITSKRVKKILPGVPCTLPDTAIEVLLDIGASKTRQLINTANISVPDMVAPDDASVESVFPVLNLIQRCRMPQKLRDRAIEVVLNLNSSAHWHVRDMAARSYATILSLLSRDQLVLEFTSLLGHLNNRAYQNQLHGRLLCCKYILEAHFVGASATQDFSALIGLGSHIERFFQDIVLANSCPLTRIAFLQLVNYILAQQIILKNRCLQFFDQPALDRMQTTLEVYQDIRQGLCRDHVVLTVVYIAIIQSNSSPLEGIQQTQTVILNTELSEQVLLWDLSTFAHLTEQLYSIVPYLNGSLCYMFIRPVLKWTIRSADAGLSQSARLLSRLIEVHGLVMLSDRETKELSDRLSKIVAGSSPCSSVFDNYSYLWALCLPSGSISDCLVFLTCLEQRMNESVSSSRFCVTQCLEVLARTVFNWPTEKEAWKLQKKYLFVLYDVLQDDDEENRDTAAELFKNVIKLNKTAGSDRWAIFGLSPPVASQQLINFFLSIVPAKEVMRQASARLIGEHPKTITLIRVGSAVGISIYPKASYKIDQVKANLTSDEDMLFKAEKQNLYADRIEQSAAWTRLLKMCFVHCRRAGDVNGCKRWLNALEIWTTEGLEHLVEGLAKEGSIQAPELKWADISGKDDGFVVIMQLLNAADVVLFATRLWTCDNDGGRVLAGLVGLVKAGKGGQFHELLAKRAEGVVIRAVQARFRHLVRILGHRGGNNFCGD